MPSANARVFERDLRRADKFAQTIAERRIAAPPAGTNDQDFELVQCPPQPKRSFKSELMTLNTKQRAQLVGARLSSQTIEELGFRDSLAIDDFFRAYQSPNSEKLAQDLRMIIITERAVEERAIENKRREKHRDSLSRREKSGEAHHRHEKSRDSHHRARESARSERRASSPSLASRQRSRTYTDQKAPPTPNTKHGRAVSEAWVLQPKSSSTGNHSRSQSRSRARSVVSDDHPDTASRRSKSSTRASEDSPRKHRAKRPSLPKNALITCKAFDTAAAPVETVETATTFYYPDSDGSDDECAIISEPVVLVKEVEVVVAPTVSSTESTASTLGALLDRLVIPAKTPENSRFTVDFLTFYRFFMSPAELLSAIISRANKSWQPNTSIIGKSRSLTGSLLLLRKWIELFPGDLAHPASQHDVDCFLASLAGKGANHPCIEHVKAAMDSITVDDDTFWMSRYDETNVSPTSSSDEHSSQKLHSASSDESLQLSNTVSKTSSRYTAITSLTTYGPPTMARTESNITLNTLPSSRSWMSSSDCLSAFSNPREAAHRQVLLLLPDPSVPLSKSHWRALMAQPEESIAQELTRIDWVMLNAIRPRDLIRHVTTPKEERQRYRSVQSVSHLVQHFNRLSCWVTNMILLRDKPKHRAEMMEKFMRVARKVRDLNNYNSLGAIVAGLGAVPVMRLAATKELIDPQIERDFLKLQTLMSTQRSHAPYRLAWENSQKSRIPYLPIVLGDLVVTENANKTILDEVHSPEEEPSEAAVDMSSLRINWKKFELLSTILQRVEESQATPYRNLVQNDEVRSLLLETIISEDDNALYEKSVALEPPQNSTAGIGDASRRRKLTSLARYGLNEK